MNVYSKFDADIDNDDGHIESAMEREKEFEKANVAKYEKHHTSFDESHEQKKESKNEPK